MHADKGTAPWWHEYRAGLRHRYSRRGCGEYDRTADKGLCWGTHPMRGVSSAGASSRCWASVERPSGTAKHIALERWSPLSPRPYDSWVKAWA